MSVELIGAVSALLVAVVGAVSAAAVKIIKEINTNRKPTLELIELKEEVKKITNQIDILKTNLNNINLMLCRREITIIYYSYNKVKKIPERDFEQALNIYTIYESLGGNGAITTIVEEMKDWERY